MVRGLMTKTLYEVWLQTLLFGAALGVVMGLLTFVVPQVQEGLQEALAQMPFVRTIIRALMGSDFGDQITAQMLQVVFWVHPVMLSILWGQEIVFCSRMPAAEIDRGTIDVLLGLPVSRRVVYACESLVWLLTGVFLLAMGLVGHLVGTQAVPVDQRPDLWRVCLILVNLYCVYVAVGGLAYLVSSLNDRRGKAMAIVFGLVVGSYLQSFLAQVWEPAKSLSFLSVLTYYQPAAIHRDGAIALGDLTTLLAVGGISWLLGGEVMARRSICTV